jgi:basic membrane protein A
VGFVGGIPAPVIKRFEAGFAQGVRFQNPAADVLVHYIGADASAFQNPYAGYRAALDLIDQQVDVVFAAAGATGLGVYQAASDRSVYAIGVDTSQNYLHPEVMVSSMLKRVDVAVYEALEAWATQSWTPEQVTVGLAEGAIGYALDRFNAKLVPAALQIELDALATQIATGEIKVQAVVP